MSLFRHAPFNTVTFSKWATEAMQPVLHAAESDLAAAHHSLALAVTLPRELVQVVELQTRQMKAQQLQICALQEQCTKKQLQISAMQEQCTQILQVTWRCIL